MKMRRGFQSGIQKGPTHLLDFVIDVVDINCVIGYIFSLHCTHDENQTFKTKCAITITITIAIAIAITNTSAE